VLQIFLGPGTSGSGTVAGMEKAVVVAGMCGTTAIYSRHSTAAAASTPPNRVRCFGADNN